MKSRSIKLFFTLILLNLSTMVLAQSTYSSANQDSEINLPSASQGKTGYINQNLEDKKVDFSGEIDDGAAYTGDKETLKSTDQKKKNVPKSH